MRPAAILCIVVECVISYLATAHGQGSEGVLEDLLKAQELDHAECDGGVEAQASLVGTNGAAELQIQGYTSRHVSGRPIMTADSALIKYRACCAKAGAGTNTEQITTS